MILLFFFATLAAAQTLSLTPPSGVEILHQTSATPDAHGVIHRYILDLPAYDAAAYWVPQGSTVRPIAFRHPDALPEGGFFLLLKQRDGAYTALLALTGSVTMAWLVPEQDRLALHVGTLGTARVNGPFPAAAWARAADPYSACREVWRKATVAGNFQLRERKKLPEFLHYLGFATWEEYRENYDAPKLVDMMAPHSLLRRPRPLDSDRQGPPRRETHAQDGAIEQLRAQPAKISRTVGAR